MGSRINYFTRYMDDCIIIQWIADRITDVLYGNNEIIRKRIALGISITQSDSFLL